jgi:hypothetical protein
MFLAQTGRGYEAAAALLAATLAGTASAFAQPLPPELWRGFGETAFVWLACLAEAHTPAEAHVSEGWLGGRDSNPDNLLQRLGLSSIRSEFFSVF